jgi:hypothetical protein
MSSETLPTYLLRRIETMQNTITAANLGILITDRSYTITATSPLTLRLGLNKKSTIINNTGTTISNINFINESNQAIKTYSNLPERGSIVIIRDTASSYYISDGFVLVPGTPNFYTQLPI